MYNSYRSAYKIIDKGRLTIASLFADNVAIFFMITGFFLFNGKKYSKILKNTIIKILIPSFLLILFSDLFFDWITNKNTLIYCLENPKINFNVIFNNLFNLSLQSPLCIHLWYIFTYVKCVLWYPLLNLISKEEKDTKFVRKIIAFWIILEIIIGVIQNFYTLPFGEISMIIEIDKGIFWVMIGSEIYKRISYIKNNKKLRLIGLLMVIFGNIFRVIAQYFACKYDLKNEVFLSWGYGFTYITAIGLALFILSLDIKNTLVNKVILFLASNTFYIYLIHWAVKVKLDNVFQKSFLGFGGNNMNFPMEILYTVISIIIVFTVSLLITIIINITWKIIKNIFLQMKKVLTVNLLKKEKESI